ncbi:WSSV046 [White spot syndrome virus]|uniref:WSSV046 n=1 Tax=White spot syndrome virus TaxID=342409 RepID=A0A2I6SBJ3_9VIRU|nr:WSSV046 [White spot syndrome virus]
MAFWGRRNSIARRGELSMSLRKKPCFLEETHNLVKLIIVIDDAIIDIGSKGGICLGLEEAC